ENAHARRPQEITPWDTQRLATQYEVDQENETRAGDAAAAENRRRKDLDALPDGEVGRPPGEINQAQCKSNAPACGRARYGHSLVHFREVPQDRVGQPGRSILAARQIRDSSTAAFVSVPLMETRKAGRGSICHQKDQGRWLTAPGVSH